MLPQSDFTRISPWFYLDFSKATLDFVSLFDYIYIRSKTQIPKKYYIAAKISKFDTREILEKSLCSSMPAEKLGNGNFFGYFFTL